MGGGSTPTTQTTTVQLSPEQRELYKLAMPNLKDFAANPPQAYPGSTVPGFDPLQTQGQGQVLGVTGEQGNVTQSAATGNQFLTSGDVLRPDSNPALQGYIDAAVRPIYQNLEERALPAARSGAQQAGQFGGSRQALVEGAAIRDAGTAAGDTAAKIASTGYGQGLDAMTKGLGLSGTIAQGLTIPGTTTSAVGDVRRDLAREMAGESAGKWNYEQMLPLLVGQQLAQIAGGMPAAGSTTSASNPQTNPFTSALGGAAAGASLGSALLPGFGALPGAALGGLLPFLS
jgi:hypothetical protein